jgi:hypothetical protein
MLHEYISAELTSCSSLPAFQTQFIGKKVIDNFNSDSDLLPLKLLSFGNINMCRLKHTV